MQLYQGMLKPLNSIKPVSCDEDTHQIIDAKTEKECGYKNQKGKTIPDK